MEPSPSPILQDPLALVTGAGRRLGKAIAVEMARRGFAVGVHYFKSEEDALDTSRQVESVGQKAYLLQADLRKPEDIQRMFDQVRALPSRLKVLVNSAAEMLHANLHNVTAEAWDAALALNLRAPMLCGQAAAHLMKSDGGVIINISDAGADRSWTGFPAYIVSKAGLEALTRLQARALAPEIRVNAVAPGLILPSEDTSPVQWQCLVNRLPMQRPGSPEDVAKTVAFLIENSYITGEIVAVDGGYRLG